MYGMVFTLKSPDINCILIQTHSRPDFNVFLIPFDNKKVHKRQNIAMKTNLNIPIYISSTVVFCSTFFKIP